MRPLESGLTTGRSLNHLNDIPSSRPINVLGDQVKATANSSKTFLRNLDKLGLIVSNHNNHAPLNNNDATVFAHRDRDGTYKLESGLYISDPRSGDGYADFKFYQGRGAKKYQTSQVAKLEFTEKSLKTLQETYRNVVGPTAFLSDLLALRPGNDLDTYKSAPELFSYLPPQNEQSNGFLIFPNLPYIDTPSSLNAPAAMKDKKEGVAICAYAIHPNQDLKLIQHMDAKLEFNASQVPKTSLSDTRTANDIEAGSTAKYISSILDLDIHDIPMLERLSEHILKHLTQVYNVDIQEDKVQFFFHFPVAEVTATLHLHVRVNKADHPLNEARSFTLPEIINVLKSGGSVIDMILARNNGVYYTGADESVAKIKNIPNNGTVDNPYILTLSQPFEKNTTPTASEQ